MIPYRSSYIFVVEYWEGLNMVGAFVFVTSGISQIYDFLIFDIAFDLGRFFLRILADAALDSKRKKVNRVC